MFYKGDRVRFVGNACYAVEHGEIGTYIQFDEVWGVALIRWDKPGVRKHNCRGLCEQGHGWGVSQNNLAFVEPTDLGELPLVDPSAVINDVLFGGTV